MSKIYFSHRLDESPDAIKRITTELKKQLGADNGETIFTYAGDISPGEDFHQTLSDTIQSSDALLIAIGDNWHEAKNKDGQYLLQDPTDVVRTEIESALIYGVPVIPVLINGSMLPLAEQVPPSLIPLTNTMPSPVRATDFDHDIEQLATRISSHTQCTINKDDVSAGEAYRPKLQAFKKLLTNQSRKAIFLTLSLMLLGAVVPLAASIQEKINTPAAEVLRELPFTTNTRVSTTLFSEISGTVKIADNYLNLSTSAGAIRSKLNHKAFIQSARFGLVKKLYAFDRFTAISWAEPHTIERWIDNNSHISMLPMNSTISLPTKQSSLSSSESDSDPLKDHWLIFQVTFGNDPDSTTRTTSAHSDKDIFNIE